MENLNLTLEYCARFGLRLARGNNGCALVAAEERFQDSIGREVSIDESRMLAELIDEIANWTEPKSYVISAA